jgi:hypothetical protein
MYRLILLLVIAFPTYALAGTLHGTVTASANKTPIANARVVLKANGHEQTATTDAEGRYQFSAVEPSLTYSITIEATGLQPFSQSDIVLTGDEAREIDANLELLDVHSSVIVTQGVLNLDAASAEISQTIGANEIEELPSVIHSAIKYALLDPHVLQPLPLGGDYQDANRLSINGASYRHTSFMLDGTTNYDWVYANGPVAAVAPASVDSVKVLTGDYPAQYGNSTAGIIAITTAAGTNTHHGDFFSYIRPSGTQASPALATAHVPNERLDWGGSAGGPLVGSRTNYFASYERVQQARGAVITSPTPGFYIGQSNEYSALARVDHDLTRTHALTARFNGNHYATDNANDRISSYSVPSYGRTARIQSWGGQVSDRAIFGGDKVNVVRFAYTNYFPDSARPLDASVGVVVPNYLQAGYSTYSWVHAQQETAGDLLAFHHGHHELKFGGEIEHVHVRDYSYTPDGTYYYNTSTDYLNNNPYKYMQTYNAADVHYGQKETSVFAQDDFHATPRLTASVGLRYEYQNITDSVHNVGPRVGLAWDATGDGKTVIRAGSGIFFDQYYMYLNRRFITLGPNSPQYNYTWDCTATPNPCPTYPNSVALTSNGTQSATVSYLYLPADKLLNPYSYQVSASVEREITRNTILTLSGLQVHTLHQMRVNDINHPTPFARTAAGQTRSTTAANATRPYTSYAGVSNVTLVDVIENGSSSIFQSFDALLKSRIGRWGEVNAHYMLSASYSYAMFYADYNSGVPNEWWPGWDKYERGPSDFYQRNHFIADAILHGPSKTTLALVGNFGSGLPVNPITGIDNNGDGYTVDRPVGYGRNSFRTPALRSVDMAVSRKFHLCNKVHLNARVQALNLLNSRNYINVNNTFGNGATAASTFLAPKAGIGNTNPSRQLEFVAHIVF